MTADPSASVSTGYYLCPKCGVPATIASWADSGRLSVSVYCPACDDPQTASVRAAAPAEPLEARVAKLEGRPTDAAALGGRIALLDQLIRDCADRADALGARTNGQTQAQARRDRTA